MSELYNAVTTLRSEVTSHGLSSSCLRAECPYESCVSPTASHTLDLCRACQHPHCTPHKCRTCPIWLFSLPYNQHSPRGDIELYKTSSHDDKTWVDGRCRRDEDQTRKFDPYRSCGTVLLRSRSRSRRPGRRTTRWSMLTATALTMCSRGPMSTALRVRPGTQKQPHIWRWRATRPPC